jgi:hypothetical protein
MKAAWQRDQGLPGDQRKQDRSVARGRLDTAEKHLGWVEDRLNDVAFYGMELPGVVGEVEMIVDDVHHLMSKLTHLEATIR